MIDSLKFVEYILVIFLCFLFGFAVGHITIAIIGRYLPAFIVGVPVCLFGSFFIAWVVGKMFDKLKKDLWK